MAVNCSMLPLGQLNSRMVCYRDGFKVTHPDSDTRIAYTMSQNQFNCRQASIRRLESAVSFRNGRSSSSNELGTWEHPNKDSLGHAELETICSTREWTYIGATGGASFYYSASRTAKKD